VESEIFPRILVCLKDDDHMVRKNAATCILEIAKQTPEMAKLVIHSGGASSIVEYITES
jgi:vesicle coat complex subunit